MNKRVFLILSALLLTVALLASAACGGNTPPPEEGTAATGTGNTSVDGTKASSAPVEAGLKISRAKADSVRLTDYDNGLISLKVPEGWMVEVPQVDYIHYSFRVYDPDNMNYMFLFSLKTEGFLKSEAARQQYRSLYPDAMFSKLAPIDPQTAEAYFSVWNENAEYSNTEELGYNYFPDMNDFTVVENMGAGPFGGDVLRATFTNAEGEKNQGLFTATVSDPGSYYMFGLDLAPLNVYHTILMFAPDDDFVNWQPIYDECIASLQFSTAFVNGFNAEEGQLVSTIIANQRVYDSISDMIMDSWAQRSTSYDIISQKQSDATLGYERVYDTETNEIYRAYNGFTDDYTGDRYKAVTDDMYALGIDGYIEK